MNQHSAGGSARRERLSMADAGVRKRAEEYTDRFLVLLDPQATDEGMAALRSRAGIARAQRVGGAEAKEAPEALQRGDAVVFDKLGVGVVTAAPDQRQALRTTARDEPAILAAERERVVYASQVTTLPAGATVDYLKGYQEGVEELVNHALRRFEESTVGAARAAAVEEAQATWGLQATRVTESAFSGKGVKVAVLDTGVDVTHPDLADHIGKAISFVPGESVKDVQGHGTHCIGTACGPREPHTLPRYGVAHEAEICAYKVLDDSGSGTDSQILGGIEAAIGHDCRVISMSLGAPTFVGQRFSQVFENVALRALEAGTVIVAAAGNESERPDSIQPVAHPANCPSILAVGALDQNQAVAFFSDAGLNPDGGQVDIAAPGVDVLSAAPQPLMHQRMSGTSMATPHVAGILALIAEAHPQATSAAELKTLLLTKARRLPLASVDVGVGLTQAP
ncbi:S8 family serine peptidase [Allostreptomyces psammosilenae]|uniref:Subtilisin family serine protease n=1 Tax=Allostreptomyces psammosilenae TaxID=1892865 RepID=A0A853ABE3_9ACTN|nr:S8 family serine peptidase [Allostreptomyces psammosilenae]NYI07692.1 subtilisin family serine protease [Allostreptomyces psammosilenae]